MNYLNMLWSFIFDLRELTIFEGFLNKKETFFNKACNKFKCNELFEYALVVHFRFKKTDYF